MERLIPLTIERIPRLTKSTLEDLLLRRSEPTVAACLGCRAPGVILVPIDGKLLCAQCSMFQVLGIRP